MLFITLSCSSCLKTSVWYSQPYCHNRNVLLSVAIKFSGATCSKVFQVLRHMGVAHTFTHTFFRHQHNILIPAVNTIWVEHQKWNTAMLQTEGKDLAFLGDGRAGSPGHSVKCGSYSMIELEAKCLSLMYCLYRATSAVEAIIWKRKVSPGRYSLYRMQA